MRRVLLLGAVFACLCSNWATGRQEKRFALDDIADRFPYKGFETEIGFWKRIFTAYGERDVLLHDGRNLDLIYGILKMPASIRNDEDEAKRQREHLGDVRKQLAARLEEISDWGTDSPNLEEAHRNLIRIVVAAGQRPSKELFSDLGRNVRSQRGIREKFLEGLIRSGRYLGRMERIFADQGLPPELALLPHVESSFDYNARSHVGAVGIWQFMRGTGRRFMTINRYVDERHDPLIATRAAAAYMKENYDLLQSWPLAITGYNHGPQGMVRAKGQYGDDFRKIVDNYRSRTFGFSSKNFYPSFLAGVEVASNYRDYFGEVDFEDPLGFDTVHLKHGYHVSHFNQINLADQVLRDYNPRLTDQVWERSRIIPAGFALRVPLGEGERVEKAMAGFKPSSGQVQVAADGSLLYRVRPGNTLAGIAGRFGTSVNRLTNWNHLANANTIYVGQMLVVAQPTHAPTSKADRYQVKNGDSLSAIAKRFQTTIQELLLANDISNPDQIYVGQVLIIRSTP